MNEMNGGNQYLCDGRSALIMNSMNITVDAQPDRIEKWIKAIRMNIALALMALMHRRIKCRSDRDDGCASVVEYRTENMIEDVCQRVMDQIIRIHVENTDRRKETRSKRTREGFKCTKKTSG
eukprot:833349_1